MTRWERKDSSLTPHASTSSNLGVGPHRTATLRRAYLTGRLVEYLTILLEASTQGLVAPPPILHRHHYRPSFQGAAIVDALRDNVSFRKKRAA